MLLLCSCPRSICPPSGPVLSLAFKQCWSCWWSWAGRSLVQLVAVWSRLLISFVQSSGLALSAAWLMGCLSVGLSLFLCCWQSLVSVLLLPVSWFVFLACVFLLVVVLQVFWPLAWEAVVLPEFFGPILSRTTSRPRLAWSFWFHFLSRSPVLAHPVVFSWGPITLQPASFPSCVSLPSAVFRARPSWPFPSSACWPLQASCALVWPRPNCRCLSFISRPALSFRCCSLPSFLQALSPVSRPSGPVSCPLLAPLAGLFLC